MYGTRNVCQTMIDVGKASAAFVADMSTGWSGNMGFRMPENWHYNQIVEASESFGGTSVGIDHDALSSRAAAINMSLLTVPPTEKDGSTPAEFDLDVLYDWEISAEIACEKALHAGNSLLSPIAPYSTFIPDYILGWLRKPEYWSTGEASSIMWQAYTPEPATSNLEVIARTTVEQALGTTGPDAGNRPAVNTSYRDVPHMAVTCLGYRGWGVDIAHDESSAGDLGGWLLDLLSLWGQYQKHFQAVDLPNWLGALVGKIGGVTLKSDMSNLSDYLADPASKFSYADVLADADGWLLAMSMSSDASGLSLSNAMRVVFQDDGNGRIRDFYRERFGANPDNVSAAFAMILNGIDVWGVNLGFSTPLVLQATDASRMPSQEEADALAHAYAAFMASPHR